MNVAETISTCLQNYGVRRVYGLVGTSVLDFVDALSYTGMRYISTRHEQVAASMADAEGRLTRFPGVAVVHGGPGFLNAIIGLANAYKDSSPLLLISGAVKRRMRGYDGWLEVPQVELAKPLTKLAIRLDKPSEASISISKAFWTAASDPQGPCYLEVPEDVWALEAGAPSAQEGRASTPFVSDRFIDEVSRLLVESERPLILAGGGLNTSSGSSALMDLLNSVEVLVATTGNGRGVIPEDHPLCVGRVGFGGGNIVADYALEQADLVIASGCGISDVTTYGYNLRPKGNVVVVDFDSRESKPIRYLMHENGDAANFLMRLKGRIPVGTKKERWGDALSAKRDQWNEMLSAAESRSRPGFVNPSRFFKELGTRLPAHSTVTGGQGLHILYAHAYLKAKEYASFLEATNLGAMGFAFPAALGAKLAAPDRDVIAVLGDGEFMMTLQDFETAVREKIPVKVIIVNDSSYRVLLMRQIVQKMGRIFGTTHTNPDIMALGSAFGFRSMTIADDSLVPKALDFLFEASSVPSVLELVVNPEDLPPVNLEASLKF